MSQGMRISRSTLLRSLCGTLLTTAVLPLTVHAQGNPDMPAPVVPAPAHLAVDDTIGNLLAHPAFAGFASRLLPWDGQSPDPAMRLHDIGRLLPYHRDVDPETVVAGLNRMIDEAAQGQRIFVDIYSEAERAANPGLEHTGLFFVRGRPGAPFAVIAAGGGFTYVASLHEGFPYAQRISDRGYNAFVLKYRSGVGQRAATADMARAVAFVLDHAKDLEVAPQGWSAWGSSAGARMAAAIGSHGPAAFGAHVTDRPATVVMAYSGHAEVARDEPPTFVVVGGGDGISPPEVMELRMAKLRAQGATVDYLMLPDMGHGFGPGTGTSAEGWIDRAVDFWVRALGD